MSRKIGVVVIVIGLTIFGVGLAQIKASTAPKTLKIGLIAPFEGHYRATGYEVLFAVKQALQEHNQGDGLNGYRLELVALNDFNDPAEAYRQAQSLVADPDVVGVVGHFSSEATEAALPVYQQADLAVVVPWSVDAKVLTSATSGVVSVAATREDTLARLTAFAQQTGIAQLTKVLNKEETPKNNQGILLTSDAVTAGNLVVSWSKLNNIAPLFGQVDVGNRQLWQVAGPAAYGLIFVSPGPNASEIDSSFVDTYMASAGFPSTPRAILAYDATNVLLNSIEQVMIRDYHLLSRGVDRSKVSHWLKTGQHQGLTGAIAFEAKGQRYNAPVWIYQITETGYPGALLSEPYTD